MFIVIDPAKKEMLFCGSFIKKDDKDFPRRIIAWLTVYIMSVLMHQYVCILKARANACTGIELWKKIAELARRAYTLLAKKSPDDPAEGEQQFNDGITLLQESTANWPGDPEPFMEAINKIRVKNEEYVTKLTSRCRVLDMCREL
ncbi:uncharacterized protein BT62DRAFT_389539 [Guyanagaster necrorhizus]|uniref:Uncharacterized protein n=1 Tax=Guyanagaster necrorhizus TaxID=856835 RepID=A0A9P7W2G5_9AGAR|nr:uncharacterized protein BT62DRAFT_389539 [Guyanagaster necrorhizus MCA 3950]KAG7450983.1 hypothetical protein BT62DRAFT_389539 [Guyanagaster necrorhizus MCA 3950]